MQLLGVYRRTLTAPADPQRGRLKPLSAVVLDHRHSAIVNMISVFEDFAVAALKRRVDDVLAASDALTDTARDLTRVRIENGWDARRRLAVDWFGFKPREFQPFLGVEAFIEARNSIAHGLGSLTRRQLSKDRGVSTKAKLLSVGIDVKGTRLDIPDRSVLFCGICVKATIVRWDVATGGPIMTAQDPE
jgi:hypothetical protein